MSSHPTETVERYCHTCDAWTTMQQTCLGPVDIEAAVAHLDDAAAALGRSFRVTMPEELHAPLMLWLAHRGHLMHPYGDNTYVVGPPASVEHIAAEAEAFLNGKLRRRGELDS